MNMHQKYPEDFNFFNDNIEEKPSKWKQLNKGWKLLLGVLIIASAMLLLAIAASLLSGKSFLEGTGIRVEIAYVISGLIAVIAVFVIILLLALKLGNSKEYSEQISIHVEGLTAKADAPTISEDEMRGERFCMLSQIDRNKSKYGQKRYETGISLEYFCESFRNYAASNLKLYYDIEDIRRFVAGMGVSRMLILQGMSGTGKTSLAHAFGSFVDNSSTVIPVQPIWKERSDLIGYYNEFTKRFNETLLLEKMYEANYSKDMYVTILDEMNIARVEYYFAEFLSLLELPNPDERYLDVVSDKWESDPAQLNDGRIKLPVNMWFIGTANNDDSTFAISDKVYDRAMVLNLDKKSERFAAPSTGKLHISAEQFERMIANAIKEYDVSRRNQRRLEMFDKYLIEHYHITFGNRIMKQIRTYIPVYIACGGEELAALDDILSKKVIRKLEAQNPIYFRNTAPDLIAYMDELFGTENMTMCKEYINRIQRNA